MRGGAVAILLVLTSLVHAAERKTVVLLPLTGPTGAEGETVAEAARDLLAAAISNPNGPRLVDREALDRMLAEQDMQARSSPEAVHIGKLLKATHAVKGTVARDQKGWHIVLVLLSVPEGTVLGTVKESGPPADAAAAAARKLAGLLAVAKPPAGLREDPGALASFHYLRGIGFLRAGLSLEAIGELLEAKRLAVRFPETRFWMARAYLDAGQPRHAIIEAASFLAEAADHSLAEEARGLIEAAGGAPPRPSPEIQSPAPESPSPEAQKDPSVPSNEDPLDRLRRELLSPSAADRHAAAQRAAAELPRNAKEDGGPVLPILLEVARADDPTASLNALRVLIQAGRPEGLALIIKKIVDEDVSPAHRTEMLRFLQSSMASRDPALQAALFTLILHENLPLRQMVYYLLDRTRADAVPEAARKAALGALKERRFPNEANHLAWMVRWKEVPSATKFAGILLDSKSSAERLAGFGILSRIDPHAAAEQAWVLIEDVDFRVQLCGLSAIGRHPEPGDAFQYFLDRWESLVRPIENINLRRSRDNQVRNTLLVLARRAFDLTQACGTPVPPQTGEGPAAFRRWYDIWAVRVRNYEEILEQWKSAEGSARDLLLVEMASTGHPDLLRRITYPKLGPAELDALAAFAAAVGFDGREPPAAGADRRAIGIYLNQITNWLTGRDGRW